MNTKYATKKENNVITNINERIVVTINKGVKIEDYTNNEWYRKDRIVKNRPLPKWIVKAIEEGNVVAIDKVEVADDFYVTIRGKVLKPEITKEYGDIRRGGCSNDRETRCWLSKLIWEVKNYNDMYVTNENIDEEMVDEWKYTKEEYEEWKKNNPLPEDTYKEEWIKIEEILKYPTPMINIDGEGGVGYAVYEKKRHTETGSFFRYRVENNVEEKRFEFKIEESKHDKDEIVDVRTMRDHFEPCVKMELIREYDGSEDNGKYLSDDERGWRTDTYHYHAKVYKITMTDGSEYEVTEKKSRF